MNWSRRAVLRSGAAMIPTLAFPSGGQAERFAAGLLTLVLEPPQWPKRSPLTLHALDAFARRGLPVAVAFESQDDGRGGVMAEPLPGAIQAAGLIELVAPLPEIVGLNRYEQMRAAADHRANLSTRPPDGHPVVTLIARSAAGELDWSAFRSAGFRVIIVPDGSPAARAEVIGRDQLRLVGGAELSFAAGGPTLSEQTEAAVVGNTSSMLVLSLAKLGDAEDEAVTDQIDDLAGWLSDKVAMGELVMVRPMDHLLQSGQLIQQQVALLVDVEESSEESGAALLILLDEAGIPVTLLAPDTVLERLGRPRDCRRWAVEARTGPSGDAGRPRPLDGATCVVASPPAEVTASSAARVLLVTETGSQAWTGLRGDGRFRATLETWSSQGPGHSVSPLVDRVLRIDAALMETPQRRSALLRTLTEEAASGRIRFWALPEWSEHLLAPDPLLTRYWNARSRLVSDPPRSGTTVDLAERDELLRDARAAWRYIERHTDDWTGLCATTVQGGAGGRVNSEATLWDVGSQIQGILGAARLGLIPQKDCVDRIALIVRNIPTADIHGLRLPPAIFRANDLSPVRPEDFDLCDLGRFLIALDSAVDQGVLPPAERDRVWMSWDIDAAVHDGRIHTFDNGRWRDITWSHCTDYVAPTFRRRGWDIQGIFPETIGLATADESMQILYAAAAAGSYGTEPGLLAKIETGASEAERLLALVLFDAQLSWYETQGEMKSVSETPLSFPPWFSYQGLVLERDGPEAWVVNTQSRDPAFQTEEFRRRALLIGSKSAYLWKANYPHSYSDKLVNVVRERCRNDEHGFAVGVFVATLESMGDYYDINTNGIILSAIAHLLAPADPQRL